MSNENEIITVRSDVRWFAELMELKLRKHDHDWGPTGWKDGNPYELLNRINEEMANVRNAVFDRHKTSEDIISKLADIANYCMMTADICREKGIK